MLPRGKKLFIFCLTGCILLPLPVLCQTTSSSLRSPRLQKLRNTTFDQISMKEGLPNATMSGIAQDRRGFVWFTTAGGLCRYDGNRVRVFENVERDSTTVSHTYTTALRVDRSGLIWVGTVSAGLDAYNPVTGRFTRYRSRSGDSTSLGDPRVMTLHEDRTGQLWIGTRGGLNKLVRGPEGQVQFRRMRSPQGSTLSLSDDWIQVIQDDEAGFFWLGGMKGLYRADSLMRHVDRVQLDGESLGSTSVDIIACLTFDSKGMLWIGTEQNGMVRLDPRSLSSKRYGPDRDAMHRIPGHGVYAISEDRAGFLWVGTHDAGLFAFDPETDEYVSFTHSPGNPRSLCNNTVWCLFQDDQQSLWVGTMGGGISRIDRNRKQFFHLTHEPGNPNSIGEDNVGPVFEDSRGAIWIGTYGSGVDVLDRATWHFRHFAHADSNDRSLTDNYAYLIYEDRGGRIWITSLSGLNRFEPATQSFRHDFFGTAGGTRTIQPEVCAIGEDFEGTLWAGFSPGGLGRMNRHTEVIELVSRMCPSVIIAEEQTPVLWFGTYYTPDGLVKFNTHTLEATKYLNKPQDSTTINENGVWMLRRDFEDPEHILWVGTSNGLNRFDKRTGIFQRITDRDGLPNGPINSAVFDRRGQLWMGTSRGLSRFNTHTRQFRTFDVQDGIQGNESGQFGLCLTSSGEMVYGGKGGVTIFHPDSIRDNPHIPPIVFTDFKISNTSVIPGAPGSPMASTITEAREITFSYLDNMISFEFAALDYTMPAKNRYAYKMEGFDRDWINSGNVNVATYTNLDPGTYTFRVKGSNNDGVWNEQGTSLLIVILPPWWETWWAYTGYLLTAIGLMYLAYRERLRRIHLKQQAEMEHFQAEHLAQVDRLKSRFFSNISHEFRTPLTLILGPADQAIETTAESPTRQKLRIIRENASKLFGLVNQLLDFSRLESGMMRLQISNGDVVQFLRRVVMSFESWAERKKIDLEFRSDTEMAEGFFDRDKLEKIVNNLMSNALKFTPEGGTVTVRVNEFRTQNSEFRTQNSVSLSVSDTGTGIPPEHLPHIFDRFYRVDETHTTEGTGIGLALTKELVELHHGSITVESTPGTGSVFTVVLSVEKSAYRSDEISETPYETEGHTHIEAATPVAEAESIPSAESTEGKPVVLVVEDNADLRDYIREYLETDYAVSEAGNGKEGYDKAVELVPDLVISDVMMPEMDGMELCKALKQDVRTSHVPVILLTARAGTDSKIEGLEIGADDYVTKPFDLKELIARARNLIEQRRQLRKKFSAGVVLKPGEVAVSSLDDTLLKKIMDTVEKNMGNENFSVDDLAQEAFMSRRHLSRKLHALTNLSPAEFIQYIRLQRARELLERDAGAVAEIAYQVGFGSPSHFSACFRERFGILPSEIRGHGSNSNPTSAPQG